MDEPPPYEAQGFVLAPKFHIRKPALNDAAAVVRLDQHMIDTSLRSIRESVVSLSLLKSEILLPNANNLVQIIAVPISEPTTSIITSLAHKFKSLTADLATRIGEARGKSPDITAGVGILGYAILFPYTDGLVGSIKCYDRTARLNLASIDETVMGEQMFWEVNSALIDEAMKRSREQGDRYKTVLTSMTFSDNEPGLVRWRDLLIDRGFEQVGYFKGVVEKQGKVMDRLYLQKDVGFDGVEEVRTLGVKAKGKG